MKIEEKINESIKDSMKEKNSLRLDSLRAIKSAILIEKTKSCLLYTSDAADDLSV